MQSFIMWKRLIFFLLLSARNAANGSKTLHVGGLFPLSGPSKSLEGRAILSACQLAIEMVNNRTDILPGYELQLLWNDSKCDPGLATDIFYEYIYTKPTLVTLLGDVCASVSQTVAQSAHHWNLIQISYTSAVPGSSARTKYPLLFSPLPLDIAFNPAQLAFLKRFGWRRVATLAQCGLAFNKVMKDFHKSLKQWNFTLIASKSFVDDPSHQLQEFKRKDARIVIGMFDEDEARRVFCEAYKLGMYGADYVWLILDRYNSPRWWIKPDPRIHCTPKQMLLVAQSCFTAESATLRLDDEPTISGLTTTAYLKVYGNKYPGVNALYSPIGFDSVWSIALALNTSIEKIHRMNKTLEEFSYHDGEMTAVLKTSLENLQFDGVTGFIKFNEERPVPANARIAQLQNGSSITVGIYDSTTNKIIFNGSDQLLWPGPWPPTDGVQMMYEVLYIDSTLFWAVIVLASLGIILACIFLIIILKQRKHSSSAFSETITNIVIISGCIVLYASLYFVVLDNEREPTVSIQAICKTRRVLLAIGYSLMVGTLFVQMWRAFKLSNKTTAKLPKDGGLLGFVFVLVLIDVLVMGLWFGLDTPQPRFNNIGTKYETCYSVHTITWLYVILGYKVMILLAGCFVAGQTRGVNKRFLQETRCLSAALYSWLVFVVTGLPLAFYYKEKINAFAAVVSVCVVLPNTATLCLVCVPQIKLRKKYKETLHSPSLSGVRSNRTSSDYSNSSYELESRDDTCAVIRLQDEILRLQQEILELKTENRTYSSNHRSPRIKSSPRIAARPKIAKRAKTCFTAQQLAEGFRSNRAASFSGSVFRRRSLDVAALHSLKDPVDLMKIENHQLKRQLHESKISETGKVAKLLYENAHLNRQISELNSKLMPSSNESSSVARIIAENNELKRQLGEVSILNSVSTDVTPRLSRKRREDRRLSKELNELCQILSIDLGYKRTFSQGNQSLKRPFIPRLPPIGRSQSALDLQKVKESCASDAQRNEKSNDIKSAASFSNGQNWKNTERLSAFSPVQQVKQPAHATLSLPVGSSIHRQVVGSDDTQPISLTAEKSNQFTSHQVSLSVSSNSKHGNLLASDNVYHSSLSATSSGQHISLPTTNESQQNSLTALINDSFLPSLSTTNDSQKDSFSAATSTPFVITLTSCARSSDSDCESSYDQKQDSSKLSEFYVEDGVHRLNEERQDNQDRTEQALETAHSHFNLGSDEREETINILNNNKTEFPLATKISKDKINYRHKAVDSSDKLETDHSSAATGSATNNSASKDLPPQKRRDKRKQDRKRKVKKVQKTFFV